MSDLCPMVVMVCESCREGRTSGEWIAGCAICQGQALLRPEFAPDDLEFSGGPKPARSRGEMVEAIARQQFETGGHRMRWEAAGDPVRDCWRLQATAVLNAALPGLLDPT